MSDSQGHVQCFLLKFTDPNGDRHELMVGGTDFVDVILDKFTAYLGDRARHVTLEPLTDEKAKAWGRRASMDDMILSMECSLIHLDRQSLIDFLQRNLDEMEEGPDE